MKITDSKYICVLKYAYEKHNKQVRMNGKKFIGHPFKVSRILIEKGFDDVCVLAGLLHDVREDCGVTDEEIRGFLTSETEGKKSILSGEDARLAVEVVSLLTKNHGSTPEQTIQKILNCKDYEVRNRAIAVKFADILSNTRDTIAHENTKEAMEFKIRWVEKAKRYLTKLDCAWDMELVNGIKGTVYKKDIYDAIDRLLRNTPKRELSEVALKVEKEYKCKDAAKGIA